MTDNELDRLRNNILSTLTILRDQTGQLMWLDKRVLANKMSHAGPISDLVAAVGSLTHLDYVQIDRDLKPRDLLDDFSNIRLTDAGQAFFDHGNRFVQSSEVDQAGPGLPNLPEGFVLTESLRVRLVTELAKVETRLLELPPENENFAQARGFIIAARILAETPEPPTPMIWELLNRANALAGVASLIVAVIALFLAK